MIKPMTKEDTQRALERAKANRFDEYGNYGENNGPLPESKPEEIDYLSFVESMILTHGRDRLAENALGLVGEAGEVAEKIKKFFRDNTLDEAAIQKELGDVIFYWFALHGALGLDPQETLDKNVDKLSARKERGTIRGSGDNR